MHDVHRALFGSLLVGRSSPQPAVAVGSRSNIVYSHHLCERRICKRERASLFACVCVMNVAFYAGGGRQMRVNHAHSRPRAGVFAFCLCAISACGARNANAQCGVK